MLSVGEDAIAMAILLLMERSKAVVEGAGAAPLAALLENKERFRGRRVALVASGGNIDPTLLDRMIYKGLLTSGRIVTFEVTADDVPGIFPRWRASSQPAGAMSSTSGTTGCTLTCP